MIPKQIILTAKSQPAAYIEHLARLNPDFRILYFNDMQARQFIVQNFSPAVVDAYDLLKPGAYKADLFRYCALYKLGGVYSDVDIPYQTGFAQWWDLTESKLYLVKDLIPEALQVGLMASPAGHEFFRLCIEQVCHKVQQRDLTNSPFGMTGPHLAAACFKYLYQQDQITLGRFNDTKSRSGQVSIEFRLVHVRGKQGQPDCEAGFANQNDQLVGLYKLNKHRRHRENDDYYYHAWRRGDVFN